MPSEERLEYTQPNLIDTDAAPRRPSSLAESLTRLEQAVAEVHYSTNFQRYLAAQARFHRYSWGNVLLILSQRPDATQVMGYRSWQLWRRTVRRGEKGIRILVPVRASGHQELDDDPDDEPEQRRALFFRTASVFDVSQTEGDPLPDFVTPELKEETGQPLYRHLELVARSEGLNVERGGQRLTRESMMGCYDPDARLIAVREAAQLQMTKTLVHELAHHYDEATVSERLTEVVAESVAYVVCAHFDLDTGERSIPYLVAWAREPGVIKSALTRIQRVAGVLIDRVEAEAEAVFGQELWPPKE